MLVRIVRHGWLLAATCLILAVVVAPASAAPTFDPAANPTANWAVSPTLFKSKKRLQVSRGPGIQPDGRIVLALAFDGAYGNRSRRPLIRLNTDGTRDYSWGHKGAAWLRLAGKPKLTIMGTRIAPDGAVFAWGYTFKRLGDWRDIFVVKLSRDGVVDKSFARGGAWRTSVVGTYASQAVIEPRADGGLRVFIASFAGAEAFETGEADSGTVYLLRSDGSPDASTGFGGAVAVKGAAGIAPVDAAFADDLLYVLYANGENDCQVRRYSIGSREAVLDRNYGVTGRAYIPLPAEVSAAYCLALAMTPDGGAAVGASQLASEFLDTNAPFVSKLSSTGQPDSSFGSGGALSLGPDGTLTELTAFAGGSLLVAVSGFTLQSPVPSSRLVAVTSDGKLSPNFGNGGVLAAGRGRVPTALTASGSSAIAILDGESPRSPSRILRITD